MKQHLPAYAGFLLEKEIKSLQHILKTPKKPFVFMMAGIKISDKAKTLENVGKKADKILLGGGIANLFFWAKGLEVGLSKVEKEAEKIAWHIEKNFKGKIMLPLDVVVSNSAMDKSSIRVAEVYDVKKKEIILDIGPRTILAFSQELKKAKTIVWNGPLGYFEKKPFDTGTMALARLIGGMSKGRCYGVVGGGETVSAVRNAKQQEYIDHLSTGGGAMLEFLAGDKLPGIKALE
jgi:3-phosphoglycerate kinase